jgi:hypothetical protein
MEDQMTNEREATVALAMTDALVVNCISATEIVPQDVLAHYFGLACKQLGFIADEASARRILHIVAGQLNDRRRVADRLNDFLLRHKAAR